MGGHSTIKPVSISSAAPSASSRHTHAEQTWRLRADPAGGKSEQAGGVFGSFYMYFDRQHMWTASELMQPLVPTFLWWGLFEH